MSHLDFLEVEGDFAVLAVQCSFFTFSLVMPLFFTTQDEDLAGFTWYVLMLTLALVLCLETKIKRHYSNKFITCSPDCKHMDTSFERNNGTCYTTFENPQNQIE